jgi:hypothetical protein
LFLIDPTIHTGFASPSRRLAGELRVRLRNQILMQLQVAEALYYLGHLPPERVGAVGAALLSDGHDTPAIRELAGVSGRATWRELGDLFDRVLGDLGRSPLTDRDAAYQLAKCAAHAITTGEVTPYEGAAQIAYACYHAAGQPEDLRGFYYWADEWEDHPEYRAACEKDIQREAEEFLQRHREP